MVKTLKRGQATSNEMDGEITPLRFARDRRTWLAYLMLGFYAYLQSSIGPLMPALREEFGIGYTVASLHLSLLAGGSALVGLFGERIARRLGRRATFWGGGGGCALGALLLIGSPAIAGTLVSALVMGVCGGFLLMTVQANLSELHGSQRGIAIAESNVAASTCSVLAALAVGGFERFDLGWRVAVGMALVAVVFLTWRCHNVPFSAGVPLAAGRHGERRTLPPAFVVVALVLFLGVAAEWCIAYWGADYLDREGGFSTGAAAATMSAYFVAMAIGRLGSSRLARRFADRTVLLGTFTIAAAGFLMLWAAPAGPLKVFGLFIAGLGIAGIYPFTISVGMAVAPRALDLVAARLLFSSAFAIFLAPFVLGIVADVAGIGIAFGVTLPLLLLALVIVTRLRPT